MSEFKPRSGAEPPVSAQTEKVVEFFLERKAAEAMIGEVPPGAPRCQMSVHRAKRCGWLCEKVLLRPARRARLTRRFGSTE
jgi:hypothetical protein